MALCSPAGYGKSYTGLVFAKTLAEIFKTKIAAIDTEHGALSKYQGTVAKDFAVCELQHFAPSAYTAAIREAAAGGFGVLLIDSLSHAWAGVGGALAQVDAKQGTGGGNQFTAWKEVTPAHNEMIEAILAYPGHVICTMRTKMEYVLEEEERKGGRKVMVPKRVGMKPVQREGCDYEFDVVADLDECHTLIVGKTRCPAIDGQRVVKPGPEFLTPVIAWLGEGTDAPPHVPAFIPSSVPSVTAATSAGLVAATLATDLQVSEIQIACQTLALAGQPAAMLAKRGVARLEDLSKQQADEILGTLRAKVKEKKIELDKQLAAAEKEKPANPTTVSTPTGNGSSNSGPASATVGVEPGAIPERPDQVGSILPDDEKRILAYCKKLMLGDADLARILAKRMQGNPPHPTRCVVDLTYNHSQEIIANLRAALAKRFPDQAPF